MNWITGRFRLDNLAICQLSANLGPHEDYHDYHDSEHGQPDHFVPLRCKRCGKEFYI